MYSTARMSWFLLLITFCTMSSYGQSVDHYELYSKVVDSFIKTGIKYNVKTSQVIFVEKYVPRENEVELFSSMLFDTTNGTFLFNRYGYIVEKRLLFQDSNFKSSVQTLSREFDETPIIEATKFKLNTENITISNEEFYRFFRGKKRNSVDNGWRKFYRKYPGAHAVFEFSKIIFKGGYACFYAGRHTNGLNGSGDLYVLKKIGTEWLIIFCFNIWMA